MTFRVLVVCTGNICRSPLAEILLRTRLRPFDHVEVTSAGTGAAVGERMTGQAAAIAHRLGATHVAEHRARQLESWMLREADLVLALTRDHRREILDLVPAAARRTFTLREFAHVSGFMEDAEAGGSDEERLRARVALTAALRGVVPPLDRADDADVVDPYRLSDAVYEECTAQLAPAVDEVGRFLERAAGVPA